MKVLLENGSQLECEDNPLGEGASGVVYRGKPGTFVIKLYKAADIQQEAALQKIIGPEYSVVLNEPYWDELFAWPKAIVRQPRLGLLMPFIAMEKLQWLLSSKLRTVYATTHGAQSLGKWTDYLELTIKMARIVRRMHFRGLCHSDLSFNNFLVAPTQQRVVLIDCDGLVVPGFLPPVVQGTYMCMAPELAALNTAPARPRVHPSTHTDLHALATLIYWLLLQRHPLLGPKQHATDPHLDEALALGERALFIEDHLDRSNNPTDLTVPYTAFFTPAVQDLVRRAFIDGLHQPEKRPSAAEWEKGLERMRDALAPCTNKKCVLDQFVLHANHPARCPLCGQPLTNVPTVPFLTFYRPRGGMKGHYQSDQGYTFVGLPNRTLHMWHVTTGQAGDPTIDRQPKAEFRWHKQKWHLKNLDLAEMHLLAQGRGQTIVPPGQEIEITDGARLLLGPPDQCRLAYVQLIKVM